MDLNVLDLMSLRRGHFRFESGHHGEIWLDLARLFFDPSRLAPFVRELAAKLRGEGVEVVVGPLVGGAFLAHMVAVELGSAYTYAEPWRPPRPERSTLSRIVCPKPWRRFCAASGSPL